MMTNASCSVCGLLFPGQDQGTALILNPTERCHLKGRPISPSNDPFTEMLRGLDSPSLPRNEERDPEDEHAHASTPGHHCYVGEESILFCGPQCGLQYLKQRRPVTVRELSYELPCLICHKQSRTHISVRAPWGSALDNDWEDYSPSVIHSVRCLYKALQRDQSAVHASSSRQRPWHAYQG